jgi:hypothetical protein
MLQLMQPSQHLLLVQLQPLHAGLQLAQVFVFFSCQQVSPQGCRKESGKDEKNWEL